MLKLGSEMGHLIILRQIPKKQYNLIQKKCFFPLSNDTSTIKIQVLVTYFKNEISTF